MRSIAIDFDKFLNGGRLFIIGFSGSGKTTVGRQLAKKYKVSFGSLSICWSNNPDIDKAFQCMKEVIKDGCRIAEVMYLMLDSMKDVRHILLTEACVIMGKSQLKSSMDAGIRDKKDRNIQFTIAFRDAWSNNQSLVKDIESFREARMKTAVEIKLLKDIL
jgi:ABC-type dipeptide/oligopeptide/nickel transport system ATPase subunit